MLSSLAALAFAHPHPTPEAPPRAEIQEEIVVWGDPFLQWEQRWLVQSEFRFPILQGLTAAHGRWVSTGDVRMRAVLDCDKDHPKGEHRWVVRCTIDDVALQALQPFPDPKLEASGEAALASWDAAMTGQVIQLVVRDDRAILSTRFPPTVQGSRANRRRRELMRQLAMRLVAPLQVELPDWVSTGSTWAETGSRLVEMPSTTAPFGGSTVLHSLDELDGHWILQSEGRATQMPGSLFALRSDDVFRLELAGVTRIDQRTGLMVERVWSVGGTPTPSARTQVGYYTFGQMLLLEPTERPYLGPTEFVPIDRWAFDVGFAPGSQG